MVRRASELRAEVADELGDDVLRRRFLQATGAGAAALIAGCTQGDGNGNDGGQNGTADGGNGGDEGGGEVRWLMDYSSEAWQERWDELTTQYEEETGNSVKIEYAGFQGQGDQRLQTLMQSGDPPELFQGTLPQMGLLIGTGQALPANEINDRIREYYDDEISLIHTAKLGGSAEWLVPHGWQTICDTNYRQDVYDQLSLEVPKTWDQLLNNAEAIEKDKSSEMRGYAIAGGKTGKSSSDFDSLFRAAGGYYYEEVDGEIQVWFPEDIAIETLEFMDQLAQYSPDPSQLSWGSTIKMWMSGRMGQCAFVSGWLPDVALDSGLNDLATSTRLEITPTPNADDDPVDRGRAVIDGTPLIEGSEVEAAKDWMEWLYAASTERAAQNNLMNLRLLPSTNALFESDAYQNGEPLQRADGYMQQMQKRTKEMSKHKSDPSRPMSVATNHVERFPILNEMVNQVLVADVSPSEAVADAKRRYEERLEEGKQKAEDISADFEDYQ